MPLLWYGIVLTMLLLEPFWHRKGREGTPYLASSLRVQWN